MELKFIDDASRTFFFSWHSQWRSVTHDGQTLTLAISCILCHLCSLRHSEFVANKSVYLQSDNGGGGVWSPGAAARPIYPNLPYSPYSSPNSSPRWDTWLSDQSHSGSSHYNSSPNSRVRRKPLKVTKQASTEHRDNYMQLNQYKLMGQVGQGSYSIVKLAYNVAEDTNYVSRINTSSVSTKTAVLFQLYST